MLEMPAMMASLRVLSSTLWSWVRRDSTDLLNCSFAVWSLPFSLRSFVNSCVWERAVKYWTEKKVDRQSDEVSSEAREMSRRMDTFNFLDFARAGGANVYV